MTEVKSKIKSLTREYIAQEEECLFHLMTSSLDNIYSISDEGSTVTENMSWYLTTSLLRG